MYTRFSVMTFAEILLLVASVSGVYVLLAPLRRRLERFLVHTFVARHPRPHRHTFDVTDFTSYDIHKKEDNDDEHRS